MWGSPLILDLMGRGPSISRKQRAWIRVQEFALYFRFLAPYRRHSVVHPRTEFHRDKRLISPQQRFGEVAFPSLHPHPRHRINHDVPNILWDKRILILDTQGNAAARAALTSFHFVTTVVT